MKHILITLLVLFSLNLAHAEGLHGKYQISFTNFLSGFEGTFVFLLNSEGESKLFEKHEGYRVRKFETDLFFGSVLVEATWGSDEEKHHYSFSLVEFNGQVSMNKYCAVYVDGPNAQHDFEELSMDLKKWDKKTKKYLEVPVIQDKKAQELCQAELKKKYVKEK